MKVCIENLRKSFTPDAWVVDGVSFTINQGELVTLLGPSGCGKTTVLRMVAGLEKPTSGIISIADEESGQGNAREQAAAPRILDSSDTYVPPHKRGIGMVFQSYALWPNRTVAQNVAFPLEIQRLSKEAIALKVAEALKLVALESFGHRYPNELSGGQQQRVAVARALAQKPRLLLMDEPLSNLDAKLREQMRAEIKRLQRDLKLTVLYVTHDRLEALELSHRMAILDHGKLVQMGTPDEIRAKPANDFVAHFIS